MLCCTSFHYITSLTFRVGSVMPALVSMPFISFRPQNHPQELSLLLYQEAQVVGHGGIRSIVCLLLVQPQLVIRADGERSDNPVL